MRIRKIELQGFKSFVDRQSFHFGEGIAGVVGPNGCGKSNISDAIRWCIGEMSAKSLRGSEMQDVIFNGTSDRKPVGMAEVGMTFLADGEPFPGQWERYEELQVTRRLYRSGQSEYLINQEKVRRRDIQDLFLDTGISNPLYSFIEQGRVEFLISSKPEKRRELIEEAAGISRYKVRRAESLSKLEKTEQNLARTTDLTDEMAKRLRSLERQVQKAAKYRRLRAWVRQGELFLSLAKFNGLTGDRRAMFAGLREAKQHAELEGREVLRKEKELGLEREELLVIEAVVGKIRDELSELEAVRREQESARHYQNREQVDLRERLSSMHSTLGRLEEQGVQAAVELEELSLSLQEARVQLESHESQIHGARGEASTRVERLNAHRSQERILDTDVAKRISELATNRANLAASEGRKERIKDSLRELEGQGTASETELSRVSEALVGATEAVTVTEANTKAAGERVAALSGKRVEADALREQLEQSFVLARKQASEHDLVVARLESRIKSLEELQEAHAGVAEGAKRFLEHAHSRGSLAEHLDVATEEEGLAQKLLGPWLSCVLVDTVDELQDMLEELGEGDRAGLLCLEDAPAPDGLAKRFGGTERGQKALSILLSGWREADTLREAIALGRGLQGALLPDETVVRSGGVVWAGESTPDASTAVLRRRRQLSELQSELVQQRVRQFNLAEELEKAQEQRAAGQKERAQISRELEEARSELRDAEIASAKARTGLAEIQREESRWQDTRSNLEEKRSELLTQKLAAEGEIEERTVRLAESTAQHEAAESALRTHRKQGEAIEGDAAEAREALARSESGRKGAADRVDLLESTLRGVERRKEEMKRQTEELQSERKSAGRRIEELEADDLRLGESILKIEGQQNQLREKLGLEGGRLKAARERVGEMEEHLRGLRQKREKARAECGRLEMELQEVRVRIETIREQIQQRYELSLAAMLDQMDRDGHLLIEAGAQATADLPIDESKLPEVSDFSVRPRMLENESLITEWVERVQDSRKKVEMLGEVNLAALEEFVDLRARHTYLEEQRQDLEDSVAAIRKAIAQLNRTCRERFREAYDQVNTNFQGLYPRLVGGGSARLQLTNEDDLLETGVEILAQPPGKRLQNLSLLSGGEKAMTALALIFALFQVKPSPFCLLDEVDAPLDDSNGARFNQMLREMSEMSQFIVITHNKKTMEVMDTLYGVTMPKPGQSRLVSVQIH